MKLTSNNRKNKHFVFNLRGRKIDIWHRLGVGVREGVQEERTEHTKLFSRTLNEFGPTWHQKVHFSTFDDPLAPSAPIGCLVYLMQWRSHLLGVPMSGRSDEWKSRCIFFFWRFMTLQAPIRGLQRTVHNCIRHIKKHALWLQCPPMPYMLCCA